jgi:hypothetical protein
MKPAVNGHQKPYCNKVHFSKFLWNSHLAIHEKVPWCASQRLIPNSSNTDSMSFTYSSYNYVAPRPAACQSVVQIQIRKCSIRYFGFQLVLYSRSCLPTAYVLPDALSRNFGRIITDQANHKSSTTGCHLDENVTCWCSSVLNLLRDTTF